MRAVDENLDAPLENWLRQVARDHIQRWHGRLVVHPEIWVGGPDRRATGLPAGGAEMDHALRCDVATRLIERVTDAAPPWVWVTRSGGLSPHDLDLAWHSAVATAYAELGREGWFVVVTREGWRDPVSGTCRRWARLRRSAPR